MQPTLTSTHTLRMYIDMHDDVWVQHEPHMDGMTHAERDGTYGVSGIDISACDNATKQTDIQQTMGIV